MVFPLSKAQPRGDLKTELQSKHEHSLKLQIESYVGLQAEVVEGGPEAVAPPDLRRS